MPAIFVYARFPALDLWYTLWTIVAWETRIPAERRQYEVARKIIGWLGRISDDERQEIEHQMALEEIGRNYQ